MRCSFYEDENILEDRMLVDVQTCDSIKNHWMIHLKMMYVMDYESYVRKNTKAWLLVDTNYSQMIQKINVLCAWVCAVCAYGCVCV